MSKTIAEIYEEVVASEELQEEYLAAEQKGEEAILAFAAAHGCEATAEEVREFLEAKAADEGELSLDDLDQVAGGSGQGKNGKSKAISIKNIDINFDGNGGVKCQIDGKSVVGNPAEQPS